MSLHFTIGDDFADCNQCKAYEQFLMNGLNPDDARNFALKRYYEIESLGLTGIKFRLKLPSSITEDVSLMNDLIQRNANLQNVFDNLNKLSVLWI